MLAFPSDVFCPLSSSSLLRLLHCTGSLSSSRRCLSAMSVGDFSYSVSRRACPDFSCEILFNFFSSLTNKYQLEFTENINPAKANPLPCRLGQFDSSIVQVA